MSAVMKSDALSIEELIANHKPGHSLQQRFYTDPEIYQRELEKIVYPNWILAGHVSQLPEPGGGLIFLGGEICCHTCHSSCLPQTTPARSG